MSQPVSRPPITEAGVSKNLLSKPLARQPMIRGPVTEAAVSKDLLSKSVSSGYRGYALIFLMSALALSIVDRQVINILAEPIKHDLDLADWQIGLMTGSAFAIFYTTLGLPLARLAERRDRSRIIVGSIAVWSVFTVLCGFAGSFFALLAARVGVGAGEAGSIPPSHSLISDYAPREKRASALAVFQLGVPIGTLIGLGIGGILADTHDWRTTFLVVGAPGFAIALLGALTLKDPRARRSESRANRAHPPFREALALLRSKQSYWYLNFASALKSFVTYAQMPFTAAFFLRIHGHQMSTLGAGFGLQSLGFLGLALGTIAGLGGLIGILLGGYLGDRFGSKDARAYCSISAFSSLASLPFSIAMLLVSDARFALLIFFVPATLNSIWFAPVYTVAQSVVPSQMRATSSAIMLLILNAVGLGLGPIAVGFLSDLLSTRLALGPAEGVRWALMCAHLLAIGSFIFYWRARRSVRQDMDEVGA